MHYLYIPQQIPGNNIQIILEETGKRILEILGKKNKQSFIKAVAPILHKKCSLVMKWSWIGEFITVPNQKLT